MPPDPRHLLAVHPGLGLLPAGLPYLLPGDREPSVLAVPIAPASCARGLAIDLSRPALRDRVDGLGWALGVLGEAVGSIGDDLVLALADFDADRCGWDMVRHAADFAGFARFLSAADGMTRDLCPARAVVVAALGPGGVLG